MEREAFEQAKPPAAPVVMEPRVLSVSMPACLHDPSIEGVTNVSPFDCCGSATTSTTYTGADFSLTEMNSR
jgi:hypothetical protein